MEIISNIAWVFYINPESAALFENDKVGKWMYFFSDRSVVENYAKKQQKTGLSQKLNTVMIQKVSVVFT